MIEESGARAYWAPPGTDPRDRNSWTELAGISAPAVVPVVEGLAPSIPVQPGGEYTFTATVRLIAERTATDELSVTAALRQWIEAARCYADGPCNCLRVPWRDHKHRYHLTPDGLR